MSQSEEPGSCSSTRGPECSTVGASAMCEPQVKASGEAAHWHAECHYWPARCPSLTALLQKAKDIIIPYLNCSFQLNILFPSFTSNSCNYSQFRLNKKKAILIVSVSLLRINWFGGWNKWTLTPLLHSGICEFYFHILSLCSLALTTDSTNQAQYYGFWSSPNSISILRN